MNGFLKITLVSAGVAAAAALWAGNQGPMPAEITVSQPLASTVSITPVLTVLNSASAGTPFSELTLGTLEIRTDQLSDQFIVDSRLASETYGSLSLKRDIKAGAPLLASDFLQSGSDALQLRSALRDGMRAIAIQVSPETAAAGLILPGDRVDVISTRRSDDTDLQASILIRGSRVLAIDQTFGQSETTSPLPPPATITLEVTPDGATAISLARELGNLSVVISTAETMSEVLPEDGALRTTADMFYQSGTQITSAANENETTIVVRRGTVAETSRVVRSQ